MTAKTQVRPTPRTSPRPAKVVEAPLEPARIALYAVVGLVNVAVLTNLFEPFQIPKLVVLALGGAVLLGMVAWELGGSGAVRLPAGRITVGAAAFLALLGVATLANAHRLQSLFGDYGRATGLLAYAGAVVVFLSVVRTHGPAGITRLTVVLLAAGVPVVGLGVLQVLGFQPFGLTSETSDIVGTLGQANFMAGFAGMVLPLALWAVVRWRRSPVAIAAGALALATVVVGLRTSSFQAVPAMAAGALVLVLVVVHDRAGGRSVATVLGIVVAFAVVVGVASHGYVDRQVRSGLDERVLLWEAGGHMVADHPLLGSGPAGYAADFASQRPKVYAQRYGINTVADAPHDVPLSIFVTGGVLLGALYLAFVGLTGVQLVRGIRRTSGDTRLLLGGVGGAWLAYQVQSLVSIETPGFLAWHAALAGAIWVLAGAVSVRTVVVPALVPAGSRRQGSLVQRGTFVRAGAVALVALTLWATTLPVRGDVAYRHSLELAAGQSLEPSLLAAQSATKLTSWNGRYWAQVAAADAALGDRESALAAGWQAAVRAPSIVAYAVAAGQEAHALGHDAAAARYFDWAAAHGPHLAEVSSARAGYLLDVGKPVAAIADLQAADELWPSNAKVRADLARAYDLAGRAADARRTWQRVLEVDPTNAAAKQALGQTP